MDAQTLRRLADQFLKPFFSGAKLEAEEDVSTAREECIAFKDSCTLAFKVNKVDPFRLKLRRSQPFFVSSGDGGPEKKIVEAFIEIVRSSERIIGSDLEHDVLLNLQRRIVAKSISEPNQETAILRAIDHLESWANRLYEGRPVVAALGIRPEPTPSTVTMDEIAADDFSAVLSNGHDTILTFDSTGAFISHESLEMPEEILSFAPFRQLQIASWATGNRVALALNRLGEILVLKNQKLVFARRAGKWHFLTQDAIFTQMQKPQSEDVSGERYMKAASTHHSQEQERAWESLQVSIATLGIESCRKRRIILKSLVR